MVSPSPMRTPTKKRPPMEMEPGEGKAHEMKESPEEEVREGTESEEGEQYRKPSRKRSAKGAKRTKAPMDCEGCSGKSSGKCKACSAKPMKDNCGSYPMKKRSDALTAPEYLAACELGIQDRSRNYIRARLDTAQRLDLKCGNGAISEGEKCHVGAAKKVTAVHNNGRALSNRQVRQIERNILAQEAATGKNVNLSKEQAALLIRTPGTQSRKFVAASLRTAKSQDIKAGLSSAKSSEDPMDKALSRVARRELFNRRIKTGVRILGGAVAIGAVAASARGRRDSVYAAGFSSELDQLAV